MPFQRAIRGFVLFVHICSPCLVGSVPPDENHPEGMDINKAEVALLPRVQELPDALATTAAGGSSHGLAAVAIP